MPRWFVCRPLGGGQWKAEALTPCMVRAGPRSDSRSCRQYFVLSINFSTPHYVTTL